MDLTHLENRRWSRSIIDLIDDPFNDRATERTKSSKVYFRDMRTDYASLVKKALDACSADDHTQRVICQAAGLTPRCRPHGSLMSHRGMRKNAARLLARELRPLFFRPGRRWFFGTFITDLGNALEYNPVIEAGRLKRDVWKMLELINMHAIGTIELQSTRYPLQGDGRTIHTHMHTVGFTDDPHFDVSAAEETIARRKTLTNWLDAPVSVFKPIVDQAELKFRCDYLFKAPLQESYLRRDKLKRSGFVTCTNATLDLWGALRLTEILSYFTLRNATIARGELVKPKGDWIRKVNAWTSRHSAREEFDYSTTFDRLWAQCPVRCDRATPVVRQDAKRPVDPGWNTAMAARFTQVAANQAEYDRRRPRHRAGITSSL